MGHVNHGGKDRYVHKGNNTIGFNKKGGRMVDGKLVGCSIAKGTLKVDLSCNPRIQLNIFFKDSYQPTNASTGRISKSVKMLGEDIKKLLRKHKFRLPKQRKI